MNMVRAQQLGWGASVAFTNLTADSLTWAIDEVLNDPKYEKNIQKIANRLKDQPQTPMERAMFWVEYVLRHDGADFMKTSARYLNSYEYNNLDVYAVFAIIFAILIIAPVLVIRKIFKFLFKSSHTVKSKSKKSVKKTN